MADERSTRQAMSSFERELMTFQPQPARIDRDRLFFEAGRQSALAETSPQRGRAGMLWPATCAALLAVTAVLTVQLYRRPAPSARNVPPRIARRPDAPGTRRKPLERPGPANVRGAPLDRAAAPQSSPTAGVRAEAANQRLPGQQLAARTMPLVRPGGLRARYLHPFLNLDRGLPAQAGLAADIASGGAPSLSSQPVGAEVPVSLGELRRSLLVRPGAPRQLLVYGEPLFP